MRFYDYFFSYKWKLMYSFIITFLREIQHLIMSKEDPLEIIQLIKDYTFQFRENKETQKEAINWSDVLSKTLDLVHDL